MTGWALAVNKTGQRFGVNAVCAMSNRGKLFFAVYDGSFTVPVMLDFSQWLIAAVDHQSHLIAADRRHQRRQAP